MGSTALDIPVDPVLPTSTMRCALAVLSRNLPARIEKHASAQESHMHTCMLYGCGATQVIAQLHHAMNAACPPGNTAPRKRIAEQQYY